MGREWIEMPFERDSICKLYTCGLQFKMVIFLGSSCSYNKAAENLLEITAYGFSGREILELPWLEPPEFAEVCICRILSSSLNYTCGIMIQQEQFMEADVGGYQIAGDSCSAIVDTHCKFTVYDECMPYKLESTNNLKTWFSEVHDHLCKELGAYGAGQVGVRQICILWVNKG